tara:strand:+ start:943 stop:1452 length:510 start_codon:yes stop_codon:yes gene_type:complete
MNNNIINPTDLQLNDEHVIQIKRVSKATTGGRRMRFSAVVVVGDGSGHVGIGFGRANEVASAVDKAKISAKKRIFKIPMMKGTTPHRLDIKFGSVKLMIKPASPGTGIIAGAAVRAIMEQLGITDILTKNTGSTNPINVVKAVEFGLKQLRDPLMVSRQRGISLKELFN